MNGLTCERCKKSFGDLKALGSHWKTRHPERFLLEVNKLRDRLEGFGWRGAIPALDAECDGHCPQCGGVEFESEMFDTGQKSWSGGEKRILVVYCTRDGGIIRRLTV